jgi:hypothetical protein
MALDTVADYVADVRVLLQDTITPYRYADADCVTALNVTILEALRMRADLFLVDGTNTTITSPPSFAAVDTTAVPIEYPFRLGVVWGMASHLIRRDQEDVQDKRADDYDMLFQRKLLGL